MCSRGILKQRINILGQGSEVNTGMTEFKVRTNNIPHTQTRQYRKKLSLSKWRLCVVRQAKSTELDRNITCILQSSTASQGSVVMGLTDFSCQWLGCYLCFILRCQLWGDFTTDWHLALVWCPHYCGRRVWRIKTKQTDNTQLGHRAFTHISISITIKSLPHNCHAHCIMLSVL